jgi:DNA-binding CsgD family transcriptional regulator
VVNRHLQRLKGEKVPNTYRFRVINNKSQTVWVQIYVVLTIWEGKPATLNFVKDVTREKKHEIKIRKYVKELQRKNEDLDEMNRTLTFVLKEFNAEKEKFADHINSNLEELVKPLLKKIKKTRLGRHQKILVDAVEKNLTEIVAPFSKARNEALRKLSPQEFQIANLIRQGKKTKEIAELLDLSRRTIESHRKNIRSKLQIKNRKVNLRAFLLSQVL